MDNKPIFRALLWAFVAFFTWKMLAVMIWGPQAPPPSTDTAEPTESADGTLGAGVGASPATAAPSGSTEAASASPVPVNAGGGLVPMGAGAPLTLTLGSVQGGHESPFRMRLEVENRGAALARVELSDHLQEVKGDDPYLLLSPVETTDGESLSSITLERLMVDQQELDLRGQRWIGRKTQVQGAEVATFTLPLVDLDEKPVLELTMEYTLPEQPATARRYDLDVTLSVANLDDRLHTVVATLRGPMGLQRTDPRTDMRAVTVAGPVSDAVEQKTETFPGITKSGEVPFVRGTGQQPYWWAAVENKFFVCLMAPVKGDGSEGPPFLNSIKAVNLDPRSESGNAITVRLATAQHEIEPGGTVKYPFQCYLGPQDRKSFTDADNADYVRRNYYLLVARNYSWCTFSWLTEFMMGFLDVLVRIPPWNYGVAIIILVLIVRLLLHPITKKGQVNMMKMQKQMGKLAPKIEEIKKQYANDKMRLNQEMQKVYQTEGINPAGQMLTCMPMMLQMPIWVALFTGLNNNIAMRHKPFCLWINDLTGPDRLIEFGTEFTIPLLGAMTGPISSLNILPILWAVSMYFQQKLMPKPTPPTGGKTPQTDQAAQMQKMMPFMSILFALLFYNAPSGLTLYILASTAFGTIEQLRIRQHIKEMEAGDGLTAPPSKPRGPRGPMWWRRMRERAAARLQELQKHADDAHKVQRKN